MTQKDYVKLAAAFNKAYANTDSGEQMAGVDMVLNEVVKVLQSDNPRFDKRRFVNAAVKTQ